MLMINMINQSNKTVSINVGQVECLWKNPNNVSFKLVDRFTFNLIDIKYVYTTNQLYYKHFILLTEVKKIWMNDHRNTKCRHWQHIYIYNDHINRFIYMYITIVTIIGKNVIWNRKQINFQLLSMALNDINI